MNTIIQSTAQLLGKSIFAFLLLQQSLFAQTLFIDPFFGTGGSLNVAVGAGEDFRDLVPTPDGKFILGGFDYDISCNCFYNSMLKIDVCGRVDSSFGQDGKVRHTFEQRNLGMAYTVQPDGKILVAGQQSGSNAGSAQIPFVARYLANGEVDLSFNGTGTNSLRFDVFSSGRFNGIYLLEDGRILCSGHSSGNANGGQSGFGAMRFLPDGSLDQSFGNGGMIRHRGFPSVAHYNHIKLHRVSENRYILAGRVSLEGVGEMRMAALAIDSTGAIDTSYADNGFYLFQGANGNSIPPHSVLLDDGSLVVGTDINGSQQVLLAKLDPDGNVDQSFGSNGSQTYNYSNGFGSLSGMEKLPDGSLLIMLSGANTDFNYKLVKLNADGTPASDFGTNGMQQFNYGLYGHSFGDMIALDNGDWLAAGLFQDNFFSARFSTTNRQPSLSFVGNELLSGLNDASLSYAWQLNGAAIDGANEPTWVPQSNGAYSLKLIDSYGCPLQSDTLELNSVGLQSAADGVEVYPVPANETLVISTLSAGVEIQLLDLNGKTVYSAVSTGENLMVPTRQCAEGIYVLRFSTGESQKIAIVH